MTAGGDDDGLATWEPHDERAPGAAATPGFSDSELITSWGLLSEAHTAVSARLSEGIDAAGHLSLAQFDVLIRLLRQPDQTVALRRIASDVGLTEAGLAKVVNRMELQLLVATGPSAEDPGTIDVSITEQGRRATVAALTPHLTDLRHHLLEPLGLNGLRALDSLTRTLRDHNG